MPPLSDFLKWGPGALFSPGQQKAFDFIPMGVQGRPQYPSTDISALQATYRKNELVYAAINRKATAAIGPRLMVQERDNEGNWQEIPGHPFRRLMMAPIPRRADLPGRAIMDGAAYEQARIVSEDVAGIFYSEIVRGQNGLPVELHPLNPAKMAPVLGDGGVAYYEFKDGTYKERLDPRNVLVKRVYDPENRFGGLSPLAVCMGSIDADNAQTDFIRAFFNNAGVPSGIIKIKGRKISQAQADEIRSKWNIRLGRQWGRQHDITVLDEDADYQKVGAGLDELQAEAIRSLTESRISMTLDVPPLIIYAYVGLLRATYSNLKEAWASFWDASLTPMFDDWASFLTWNLLTEFVDEELIYAEKIRLAWDFSAVKWLQEDEDAKQARARENFKAGGLTLNQFLETIGEKPDAGGDFRILPFNVITIPAGVTPTGEPQAPPPPAQEPPKRRLSPQAVKAIVAAQKAGRQTIEARIEKEVAGIIRKHYNRAAAAVERG